MVPRTGSDCEIIIQDIPAAEARYTDLYGAATAGRVIQACQYGQLQQATDGAQHYGALVASTVPLLRRTITLIVVSGRGQQRCGSVGFPVFAEETLSGGWRGADDYFVALSGLLGVPPTGRYQRPE